MRPRVYKYVPFICFEIHNRDHVRRFREFLRRRNIEKLKKACYSPDVWNMVRLEICANYLSITIDYEGLEHSDRLYIEKTNIIDLIYRLNNFNLDGLEIEFVGYYDGSCATAMTVKRQREHDWLIVDISDSWAVGPKSGVSKEEFADFCKKVIEGHWDKHDKLGWG